LSPGRSSGWASLVGQALAIGLRAQTRMRRKNKEKGRGLFCRVGGFEPRWEACTGRNDGLNVGCWAKRPCAWRKWAEGLMAMKFEQVVLEAIF
jgi:hypothetical protein